MLSVLCLMKQFIRPLLSFEIELLLYFIVLVFELGILAEGVHTAAAILVLL